MQHSTELIKQANNYKAVRDRLLNPKTTVKRADLERERATIAQLREQVDSLLLDVADRDRRIGKLELDIADRNARLISQAEALAALDTAGVFLRPKKPVAVIVAEVLKNFPGVTWADVIGVRRTRALIRPRHLAMAAVYEQRTDLSLPAIGKIFGGRDHTTVLHAVHKMGANREKDQA